MIVSNKHRFIFIKTRKTASMSLKIARSKFYGEGDLVTPLWHEDEEIRQKMGGQPPCNYDVPFRRYRWRDWARLLIKGRRHCLHNHDDILSAYRYLPREVFQTYYKFSFERIPYDKVVSWYYYQTRN